MTTPIDNPIDRLIPLKLRKQIEAMFTEDSSGKVASNVGTLTSAGSSQLAEKMGDVFIYGVQDAKLSVAKLEPGTTKFVYFDTGYGNQEGDAGNYRENTVELELGDGVKIQGSVDGFDTVALLNLNDDKGHSEARIKVEGIGNSIRIDPNVKNADIYIAAKLSEFAKEAENEGSTALSITRENIRPVDIDDFFQGKDIEFVYDDIHVPALSSLKTDEQLHIKIRDQEISVEIGH